ncbi:MAG: hypothetical protein Rhob2KO_14150 [Rhodopirellula baltica]
MWAEGAAWQRTPGNEKLDLTLKGAKSLRPLQGRNLPKGTNPVVFTAFKPPATVCNPFGIKLAKTYALGGSTF